MNTDNWTYLYKLMENGIKADTNLLYVPKLNPEKNIMCMHYSPDKNYKKDGVIDLDLINWFFEREVRFLTDLQHLKCTPTLYDVDIKNKKLFIEWNNETLSYVVNDPNRSIDEELPNWKHQLKEAYKEFNSAGYYKMSLYPHCFFIDKNKQMKTIDYYAVVPHTEPYIEYKLIEGIVGEYGKYRFEMSTDNGLLNINKFHEITVTTHNDVYWPYNPFKEVYEEINRVV